MSEHNQILAGPWLLLFTGALGGIVFSLLVACVLKYFGILIIG